jgi:hypothetical protein
MQNNTEQNTEVFEVEIENGALLDAPVWESHKRGTNFFSTIALDPSAPGGLKRQFHEKARGDDYYYMATFAEGDPVEFGGDYTSGGGHRSRSRWYGVCIRKTDESATFEKCDTARQAVKRAKEIAAVKSQIL